MWVLAACQNEKAKVRENRLTSPVWEEWDLVEKERKNCRVDSAVLTIDIKHSKERGMNKGKKRNVADHKSKYNVGVILVST